MSEKQYRYELKFGLSKMDAAILKQQLKLLCKLDPHSVSDDYSYDIRSLYFDDPMGTAYQDKISGEMYRKKYRIRMYNMDDENIKLECKHKDINWTYKQEQPIDKELCEKLTDKRFYAVEETEGGLLNQFLLDAKLFGLRPSVVVDYRRLAYTYPVSEVRITFDENIKSGRYDTGFFKKTLPLYNVYDNNFVELEVKCNEFIPDNILAILNSVDKCRLAISKYALAYQIK